MAARGLGGVALLYAAVVLVAPANSGTTSPASHARDAIAAAPSRLTCYGAQFTGFRPRTLALQDRVSRDLAMEIYAPDELCAPAAGADGRLAGSSSYLMCYRIRLGTSFAPKRVRASDEYRKLGANLVLRPSHACLPSIRVDVRSSTPASRSMDIQVCYTSKPAPLVTRSDVPVLDVFGTSPDAIRGPFRLCSAAAKAGQTVRPGGLTCYTVKSETKGSSVVIRNELGFLKAALGPRARFCLTAVLVA